MRDREQLLNRRFTSNAETTIDLDYSLQHHNSMNNAHRGIDEMLMTGNYPIELIIFYGFPFEGLRSLRYAENNSRFP